VGEYGTKWDIHPILDKKKEEKWGEGTDVLHFFITFFLFGITEHPQGPS
jgi:hypothetical protein